MPHMACNAETRKVVIKSQGAVSMNMRLISSNYYPKERAHEPEGFFSCI